MKKLHSITTVLHQNKSIHSISVHAKMLNQMNLALQQILPTDFISRCSIANIRGNTLILETGSASIANLLRFQSTDLCQQISQQCNLSITQLKINVRPISYGLTKQNPTRRATTISTDNAALLSATAETINDPALKNALTKLAKRVKNT